MGREYRMSYRLTAVASLLLFVLPRAHADDMSKRAKVEELFTATKVEATMGQMVGQMSTAMKATMQEQTSKLHLTAEQQGYADAFAVKVDGIMKSSLSMETLKPLFLKIYMDTYTEEELDGILAFYRSPAGQAFLAKTPVLTQRSIQLMQQQIGLVQPQLEEAQRELMQQMDKTTETTPPPRRP